MPEWTEWPESGNIRLKQRKRHRIARLRKPLALAGNVTAVSVMIGTSAAEVYTPGKLIAFAVSAAWVAIFMIANRN